MANYWYDDGDDLASGYIASKILNERKIDHLYAYVDTSFSKQHDPVWNSLAIKSGFFGQIHPYVQIPIYAYILQPISNLSNFKIFKRIFLFIILSCTLFSIILVLKLWVPDLLLPIPFILILLLFSASIPFQYSMHLMQTHQIIIFFNILGIYLERKNKPILGGLVLSLAIAIKLIPLLIIFYWIIHKSYRAVLSAGLGLLVITSLSFLLVGLEAHIFYLQRLSQINSITLVSFNNQSVRAFLFRMLFDYDAMFFFKMHETPFLINLLSIIIFLLLFGALVFRIFYDKNRTSLYEKNYISIIFILQTICSPIAWTHYFTILFVPFTISYSYIKNEKSLGSKIFFWILIFLNMPFLAPFPYHIKNITGNNIVLFGFYSSLSLYIYLLLKRSENNNNSTLGI